MKKEKQNTKSPLFLIIGALLLTLGIVFSVITYNSSYQASKDINSQITIVNNSLKEAEENGSDEATIKELKDRKTSLSDEKLAKEKPYSYSLTLTFFGILLTLKGIWNLTLKKDDRKITTKQLAAAGLMAALCYIGFAFFKIDIPVGPEKTAFHFGNVFCVLGALLLGGFLGGLAGAVGMTIGDLTTAYVTSAPKTFLLKLLIGLIVGFVAYRIFKIDKSHSVKYNTIAVVVSSACGMAFNIVADPLVGYYYKTYLLGVPQDLSKALAKIAALTTSVNAVVAVIAASIFYLALRPALKKSGLLQ